MMVMGDKRIAEMASLELWDKIFLFLARPDFSNILYVSVITLLIQTCRTSNKMLNFTHSQP